MPDNKNGHLNNNGSGLPNDDEECFVTPGELDEIKAEVADEMDDPGQLVVQRHNHASSNVAVARMGPDAIKHVAYPFAKTLFEPVTPPGFHDDVRNGLCGLNPQEIAGILKSSFREQNAFPLDLTPDLLSKKIEDLRRFIRSNDPMHQKAANEATAVAREHLQKLVQACDSAVPYSPGKVPTWCQELMEKLAPKRMETADSLLGEVEVLQHRFREVQQLGTGLPVRVRRDAEVRFATQARKLLNTAWDLALAFVCEKAVRREIQAAVAKLSEVAKRAVSLAARRDAIIKKLEPPSKSDRVPVGREFRLAVPNPTELERRVLAERKVHDLTELATVYRSELGAALAPANDEEVDALITQLLKMLSSDCGTESVYDLIPTPADAELLVTAMYNTAHPHVELRWASEQLGVLLTVNEQLELPLAESPTQAEKREAMVRAARRLGPGIIKIIDRPIRVPVIRLCRMIAGYPSVCDASNSKLKAAAILAQRLTKHQPYQFDTPVKAGLNRMKSTPTIQGEIR